MIYTYTYKNNKEIYSIKKERIKFIHIIKKIAKKL